MVFNFFLVVEDDDHECTTYTATYSYIHTQSFLRAPLSEYIYLQQREQQKQQHGKSIYTIVDFPFLGGRRETDSGHTLRYLKKILSDLIPNGGDPSKEKRNTTKIL